jgi:hypothetical protein
MEEYRLRVLENRMFRKIFEEEEVIEYGKELHNTELHNVQSQPNMIRVINRKDEMGGTCGMHGGEGTCMYGSLQKHEKKRTLRRPTYRWEIYIKFGLEIV